MTITEFLLARIAEDEAAARFPYDMERAHFPSPTFAVTYAWQRVVRSAGGGEGVGGVAGAPTPARVLAECEAKRRIVDSLRHTDAEHWAYDTLLNLAAIYSRHPDYDESWRP